FWTASSVSQAAKGGDWFQITGSQTTHRQEDAMQSPRRALAFGVVVALGVVLGAGIESLSARSRYPRIGTWKLNMAKAKYSPGPPPQSQTLKVEPSGQGEKVTSEVVAADGTRTTTQYTANFDGKDYPLTGSQIADMVSLKRIDVRTTERTDKKGDKVMTSITRVVSADGKTMTATVKGTNAQGQSTSNVAVFEKQ